MQTLRGTRVCDRLGSSDSVLHRDSRHPHTFRSDEMGWAQFETGEGQLAIERVDPGDAELGALAGRFVGVSLQVPDIEAAHNSLVARGVEFLAPPEPQQWGGVLAHFRDPDGNVLTLLGS